MSDFDLNLTAKRSSLAEGLLVLALVLAFVDESIRKVVPNQPIYITSVKQLLVFLAGILILLRGMPGLGKIALLFVPWSVYTLISGTLVAYNYASPKALFAVIATYSLAPLLFAVGYYLGLVPDALRKVSKVYLIGAVASIVVAILQEFARGSLPLFLSARIYKESHVGAGGLYNESLFASPQILAQVMFPLLCTLMLALLVQRARRTAMSVVLVVLCGYTIYLSRIRVAVVLAIVAVLFVTLFATKVGLSLGRLAMRFIIASLGLSLAIFVLVSLMPNTELSGKGEHEKSFFRVVLDPHESIDRLTVWTREIADLPNHSAFWGYGAGTGGGIRSVIGDMRLLLIPVVSDTGLGMLYHELGVFGYVTFGICYVGIPIWLLWTMIWRRRVAPVQIASLAVYVSFLLWFLLKAHPVMGNAFSHILWLAMLGICLGAMRRTTYELPDDGAAPLEHELAYEEHSIPIPTTTEDAFY